MRGPSSSGAARTFQSAPGLSATRAAEDCPDYDRATELEAAGGRVIELAPSEWRSLAA
jgi:hypothetical protein